MKRRILIPALIAAAGLAAAGGLTYAQQGPFPGENDAIADLAGVRVSLTQAIVAAEQHVGGRAAKAELERRNGVSIFDVEVLTAANTVMDVKVDADGKVIAASQDMNDEGNHDPGGTDEDRQDGVDDPDD